MGAENQADYAKIFGKLDGRWVEDARKRKYHKDNDGGITTLVAKAQKQYVDNQKDLSIPKANSDMAHKVLDSYVDLLMESFMEKDDLSGLRSALGTLKDAEQKREFKYMMAEKHLNIDRDTLRRKHTELMRHGRIENVVYDLNARINDPQGGLAQTKATKELVESIQKEGNAVKALRYFNDNVLRKKGYRMDESDLLTLGIRPQEAIGLMQSVSAGIMTTDLIDKYGLKPAGKPSYN